MKLLLKQDIHGYHEGGERLHAEKGHELKVLIRGENHFICDSIYFPHEPIAVFPSQASILVQPKSLEELEFDDELEYGSIFEQTE